VDGAREVFALACPDGVKLSVPDAATLWHTVNAVHCSVATIKFLTGKLVEVRTGLARRSPSPALSSADCRQMRLSLVAAWLFRAG
jgi:hypothetical protein